MIIGEESETLEFKETTGEKKEAMQSIAAMLNKHGHGTVYFGVKDNGYVLGQTIEDSTKKDVSNWIFNAIYPRITPTIEVLSLERKRVIKVSFSGRNRPYSAYKEYLTRVGVENRQMSTDELKKMIAHSNYLSPWEDEATPFTKEDIDEEAMRDFYESAVSCGRLEMKGYDLDRLLSTLSLTSEGRLNNAGEALFGKSARIGLKLCSYAGESKVHFTDLKLVTGNIYNLVTTALNYVQDRMDWRVEIGARKREQLPEIPLDALREIIANAFAHEDYEVGEEVQISIHPGSIDIYNPGAFPDDLTPFDFIDNNLPSYVRNRTILDALFRSKDVEKAGTGFQRVNELCIQSGVQWEFRKEAYGFTFRFLRKKKQAESDGPESELNRTEKAVYKLISSEPRISKALLAEKTKKSEKTVQRAIASLTEKGLIMRVGSNKEGYWAKKED